MNQQCKVCGEPAAGFHFGAFTCEGCKSFFGRSYNNLNVISECKNNGACIINKKNRTSCKACRLRKCLSVGMSKSGSRYGRRSNWFKIHCLLQEQKHIASSNNNNDSNDNNNNNNNNNIIASGILDSPDRKPIHMPPASIFSSTFDPRLHMHLAAAAIQARRFTREDLDDYNRNASNASLTSGSSPSISSPDSHNSDSSMENLVNENYKLRHNILSPMSKQPDQLSNLAFPIFPPFYSPALASHPSINFVHFPSPLFSHSTSSPFRSTFETDSDEGHRRGVLGVKRSREEDHKPRRISTEDADDIIDMEDSNHAEDMEGVRNEKDVESRTAERMDESRNEEDSMEQDEDTCATLVDNHQEQPIDLSTNRSGSECGSIVSSKRSSAASPHSDINVDEFVDDDNLNNNERKHPLDLTMKV